jgi:hypothetical protein
MTRGLQIVMVALAVLFGALAVYRCRDFVEDVTPESARNEDWLIYRENAVSIVDGGLVMPAVRGNYYRPGGFLYNYFVAAVFAITGKNSSHVYLVQAVLLALSVGGMTFAFAATLRAQTLWWFAAALAVTAYLDVFRYYTFRLLSENLLLVCLSAWLIAMMAAVRRSDSWLLFAASGALLGLCVLTRPNLLPLGPAIALALWMRRRQDGIGGAVIAAFVAACAACVALLVARNVAATGQLDVSVWTNAGGWMHPSFDRTGQPLRDFGVALLSYGAFYLRRALFSVGFLFLLDPAYRFRPHWLMAWLGLAAFCVLKIRSLELWELLLLTFVVVYLVPLIAVADLPNYGFRMIFPVVPAVMLLGFRALDLRAAVRA